MADTPKTPAKTAKVSKRATRECGANVTVGKEQRLTRSVTPPKTRQYASAGRYTQIDGDTISEAPSNRRGAAPPLTVQYPVIASMAHTANFLGQSDLGPANISDSENIGYYSLNSPSMR